MSLAEWPGRAGSEVVTLPVNNGTQKSAYFNHLALELKVEGPVDMSYGGSVGCISELC